MHQNIELLFYLKDKGFIEMVDRTIRIRSIALSAAT
jgi:hypothetical protein